MTAARPIVEFVQYELNDHVRAQLRTALRDQHSGQRYFTFNASNVLLDLDAQTVTVEDEFDPSREDRLDLEAFTALISTTPEEGSGSG